MQLGKYACLTYFITFFSGKNFHILLPPNNCQYVNGDIYVKPWLYQKINVNFVYFHCSKYANVWKFYECSFWCVHTKPSVDIKLNKWLQMYSFVRVELTSTEQTKEDHWYTKQQAL